MKDADRVAMDAEIELAWRLVMLLLMRPIAGFGGRSNVKGGVGLACLYRQPSMLHATCNARQWHQTLSMAVHGAKSPVSTALDKPPRACCGATQLIVT